MSFFRRGGRHRPRPRVMRPVPDTRMELTRKGVYLYSGTIMLAGRSHADGVTWLYTGDDLFGEGFSFATPKL